MAKIPKITPGFNQQIQELQKKLLAAQEELAEVTVTGAAGGKAVQVTVTGDQQCVGVKIAPELLQDADAEKLQELVQAAVNNALQASRKLAAKKLGPFTPRL
jgi:DNA-binding YbaB/EbfC family protein